MKKLRDAAIFLLVPLFWLFAHFLAFAGVFLIFHEWLVLAGMPIILSHWFLDTAGPIIACLSLLLVSASIYFETAHRAPPSYYSLKASAPLMIAASIGFFVVFAWNGSLNPHYVDALGAIALGGAMMRLTGVPFTFPKAS